MASSIHRRLFQRNGDHARLSTHPNNLSCEPRGATREQQAIVETPAKWSAYQIPIVVVVFVVFKG
jgi:hypothetical protein